MDASWSSPLAFVSNHPRSACGSDTAGVDRGGAVGASATGSDSVTVPDIILFNGRTMPVIGLGTWKSEPGEVKSAVKAAIEAGYRHIDCAAIYGNEAEVGEALSECFASGIVKREDLFITSKLWNSEHKAADVEPALKATLSDLQLEYLDLYLIHWPACVTREGSFPYQGKDMISLEDVHISETWQALEATVDTGLTKSIGLSNFSVKKCQALLDSSPRILPAVNQVEMHPYLQQQDLLNFCEANKIVVTAYSPLGSFDRPEILRPKEKEPVLLEDPLLVSMSQVKDVTPAQLVLAWARQRGTIVIPKSVRPNRLAENLQSARIRLSEEEMERIKAMDKHRRYVDGAFWCDEGSPYTVENLWDE